MESLLPHLAVALDAPLAIAEAEDAPSLRPPAAPPPARLSHVVLEIGFGAGEHLVAQAAAQPETLFLGAEPFLNGVAACLRRIEEAGVQNIRLHHGDARDLLAALPAASLDGVYILFPDPWPKKRHWKRRLVQPDFAAALGGALKPGAEARLATDWAQYAAWILEVFLRAPEFEWLAESAADWRGAWPGHAPTRYEQKRLGDCAPVFLRFRRR